MTKRITILIGLLIVTAVLACPTGAPLDKEAITQAVLAVHRATTKADTNLDIEALFKHIMDSNDCSIIQDGRLFDSRQQAYRVVKRGFQRVEKLDRSFESIQVTVLSPDKALLVAKGSARTVLTDGRIFAGPVALTSVYTLKDGRWQILHGHYSAPDPN